MYYDYSEEFDPDKYNRHRTLEQQRRFRIEKSVPKNQQMSEICQETEQFNHSTEEHSPVNVLPTLLSPDICGQMQNRVQSAVAINIGSNFNARDADISRDGEFKDEDMVPVPNYKSLANSGSNAGSLHAPSNFSNEKATAGESLHYFNVPFSPSVNCESENHMRNLRTQNLGLEPETKSTLHSGKEVALYHTGRLQKFRARPRDFRGNPTTLSKISQTGPEGGAPPWTVTLLRTELPRHPSQGLFAQNRQLRQADEQGEGAPIDFGPAPSQNQLNYNNEEILIHIPTPQYDGSLDCSSSYSSVGSRLLSNQNSSTDSIDGIENNDDNHTILPKFKLKITRPSDSILGTVRVSRTSADSKSLSVLDLRNPRDLFTPSSDIDNIFRGATQHFYAPRISSASTHSEEEKGVEQASRLDSISNKIFDNPPSSELDISQNLAATAHPSDVQSFFSDDSSHIYGKRNLRKRLSSLKVRVGNPHSSKFGTRSYDDSHSYDCIGLRDGNDVRYSTLPATRSADKLHAIDTKFWASHHHRLREKIHRGKWREKVSGWIQGAKSMIVARIRPGDLRYKGNKDIR
jgi:hypothetical protein